MQLGVQEMIIDTFSEPGKPSSHQAGVPKDPRTSQREDEPARPAPRRHHSPSVSTSFLARFCTPRTAHGAWSAETPQPRLAFTSRAKKSVFIDIYFFFLSLMVIYFQGNTRDYRGLQFYLHINLPGQVSARGAATPGARPGPAPARTSSGNVGFNLSQQ